MEEIENKAAVLMEALPYIKKYHDKIVVIKYGRNITSELDKIELADIILLHHIGMKPVIVHGGGPSISSAMEKEGIKPKFVNGLRVTDEKTVKIIAKVYDDIRKSIVDIINKKGGKAYGLKGQENIIHVKQKDSALGLVGEITKISKDKILQIIKKGQIPVISPLGIDKDQVYNINADSAAAAIAVSLKAEKLTMMTNIDGVKVDNKFVSHLTIDDAKKYIKKGIISEGMIPKVKACMKAVENNVAKAHLINGSIKHSLLLEIFTDKGIGTEVVKNGS